MLDQCKKTLQPEYECILKARMFVPGRHFMPSLMSVGKGGVELVYALALSVNIRLCWEGLLRTNNLANFENS